MRVGQVIRIFQDKRFGFIRCDNLRDDVFFYFSVVPTDDVVEAWKSGEEVEFELDDNYRLETNRLRASMVRRSLRPLSVKLKPGATPDSFSRHHPKARQRKPTWRSPRKEE